jgi:3-deoxy-D-manno-octulosonic-acid transferase
MTDFLARVGFHIGRGLLEVIYFLILPFLYPYLAWRRYTAAVHPRYPNIQKGILVHAASLGEVNAVRQLLQELRNRLPSTQILVTTTSVTGMKAASKLGNGIMAALSVLDIPHLRRKQFQAIDPGLICVVETEIWPNFLYEAARKGTPVLFLNARMSVKTMQRLEQAKRVIRYVSGSVAEIFASSEADASRFKMIFPSKVSVAGNIKGAVRLPDFDTDNLRNAWGFRSDNFIICVGSSRPGEEKMMFDILPELHSAIPNLKLIIAIRHPQRSAEVRSVFGKTGYRLLTDQGKDDPDADVLILDVLGQLDKAYAICDLAIVGGSFMDFGGHNPLEPVYYGKPVIMGAYHSSCASTVKALKDAEAIIIAGHDSLSAEIVKLYNNPAVRTQMGLNGRKVLEQYNKSLDVYIAGIMKWMRVHE